jgi:hypothetical protein
MPLAKPSGLARPALAIACIDSRSGAFLSSFAKSDRVRLYESSTRIASISSGGKTRRRPYRPQGKEREKIGLSVDASR